MTPEQRELIESLGFRLSTNDDGELIALDPPDTAWPWFHSSIKATKLLMAIEYIGVETFQAYLSVYKLSGDYRSARAFWRSAFKGKNR